MNFPLSYIKGKNLYFAFFPHSAALLPEMCVCTLGHSVVSDCLRPYGLLPTRLLCPSFIQFTRNDSNLFPFITDDYSIVYMYHNMFIHSLTDIYVSSMS